MQQSKMIAVVVVISIALCVIYIDDNELIIAIDSTGIKIINRDRWIADKWWDRQNKSKKGYLKIPLCRY